MRLALMPSTFALATALLVLMPADAARGAGGGAPLSLGCALPRPVTAEGQQTAARLCAAVADALTARLGHAPAMVQQGAPDAPALMLEVQAAGAQHVTARLGWREAQAAGWGEALTQSIMDRATLPPRALRELADMLIDEAGIPASILPASARPKTQE